MKSFIVMLATIILGVALAGFVTSYETTAQTLNSAISGEVSTALSVN